MSAQCDARRVENMKRHSSEYRFMIREDNRLPRDLSGWHLPETTLCPRPLMSADADQVSLANWRIAPYSKWAFQHVREIVPSANVPNAPSDVWKLVSEPKDFSSFRFEHSGRRYSINHFLNKSDADGLVILHRGKVILEHYDNGMTSDAPHILMSVSKSLTAIVAGILFEQGKLDPGQRVVSIIPELKDSVYSDATVRDVLDMRVGLDFDEDYLATSGPIVEYRKSTNWNPLGPRRAPKRSSYISRRPEETERT